MFEHVVPSEDAGVTVERFWLDEQFPFIHINTVPVRWEVLLEQVESDKKYWHS